MSIGDSATEASPRLMPRVLVLARDASGHLDGIVAVLGGAGYAVDVRDDADLAGRLPEESVEYDLVMVDPRALAVAREVAVELDDVESGRLRIDASRRMVFVDGSAVRMSAREYRLLHHLAAHPDVVFSREALLRAVWGSAWRTEGSVTEYIRRLRILLEPTGIGGCIVTRKGFGYSFDPSVVR